MPFYTLSFKIPWLQVRSFYIVLDADLRLIFLIFVKEVKRFWTGTQMYCITLPAGNNLRILRWKLKAKLLHF